MKTTSWNLLVVSTHGPALHKLGLSFRQVLILVGAFVLALLITVFMLLMFPSIHVNEHERLRLAAENQVLRTENKNIDLQIQKLDTHISEVQEHSQLILTLAQAD
jgi:hypothetical protein